jgi:tetratricopeptide (TPR) repeat protein
LDTSGWERAKELFHEAVKRSPEGRRDLLRDERPEVREEVEALLRAHEEAGEPETSRDVEEGPGAVIGRYKILQEIGEGGFGVVYMAEQTEPVRRKVALKIIKLGMDTKEVVARFEAERQALALMDHHNIAKVLDGGATERGRPYFVMELVKGIPVTDYCDQAGLSTVERLELFQTVCHAIQHAHQKGIIHRDLKPSNILVTLHDGKPVPMVIDFGIAKATDRRLTEKTLFTEFSQIVGTPEYMAPEQAEMTTLDVDTRADIYSLGVLLYELLTGTKPFDLKSLLQKGYAEILRTIREVEPPKPSTRLSTLGDQLPVVAGRRRTRPKLLGRLIRGDLDWIVLKALEKDRSRRYDTATAFAADIARHLADEPVVAGPPGGAYRLRKIARRHRVAVVAAVAIVATLVAGLLVSLGGRGVATARAEAATVAEAEAARQRDVARGEEEKAREILGVLREMLEAASPYQEPDPDYTVRQLVLDFEPGLRDRLEGRPEVEAAIRNTIARTYWGLEQYDDMERNVRRARQLVDAGPTGDVALLVETCTLAGLLEIGRYRIPEAAREFERAVEVARGLGEAGRVRLADALTGLGIARNAADRFEESMDCHREAEASYRALGEGQERDLIRSLIWQNYPLRELRRPKEAEEKLREAMRLIQEDGGPEHPWYANCCHYLALVLSHEGPSDEAYGYLEKSLAANRKRLPENHVWIARCLEIMAQEQVARAKFDRAEALLAEAFEIRRRGVGETDPESLAALTFHADLASQRGQFEKAEALYSSLIEHSERIWGPTSLAVLRGRLSLAHCVNGQERYADARDILVETLGTSREVLGGEHPLVAALHLSLGNVYRSLWDFENAELHIRESLRVREKLHPPDHPVIGSSLLSLGSLLMGRAKREEALRLFQRAESIYRKHLGDDHPKIAQVLEWQSWVLRQMEDPARALTPRREACDILVRVHGEGSRRVLDAKQDLAMLTSRFGDPADAIRLCEEFLARPDLTDRHRPNILGTLGVARIRQGKHAEAEVPLREAWEILKRTRPRHWAIWGTASRLGEAIAGQGRFEEAEPFLVDAYTKMKPPNAPWPLSRKREALERVVKLYEAWDKPEKAAEWRARLESGAWKGGGDGR